MFDFDHMSELINKCGDAYNRYQRALQSAEPKSPILSDMPKAQGTGNPVERAVVRADEFYQAYKEAFDELEQMRK